jgi:hypothetical protein
MAKMSGLKIGPCVLAVALFGALLTSSSFAEDAASSADRPQGSNLTAEPGGPRPPAGDDVHGDRAKFDNHAPVGNAGSPQPMGNERANEQRGTIDKQNPKLGVEGTPKGRGVEGPGGDRSPVIVKGANSLDLRGGDNNAVNTDVTVPSRHPGSNSDKARPANSTFRIGTPGKIFGRRISPPGTAEPVTRNAIGLPLARREAVPGPGGSQGGTARIPTHEEPPGIGESGIANIDRPEGELLRPAIIHPGVNPTVGAPPARRGTIAGSGFVHPGSGLSVLGGPSKVVTGINGTTVQPR